MIKLQAPSQIMGRDETLQIVRESVPTEYVGGKAVNLAPAHSFPIQANVQPLNARDLLLVPEGDRFKEQYWVFTSGDLRDNDRVLRLGASFAVQGTEEWGSYRKAKMTRIDAGPSR